MQNAKQSIVCLGGGIGTVNLIKGIIEYTNNVTVVVSMADEGGSSGRLRKLYHILPPGDLVSCMSALLSKKNPTVSTLLTFRFPGDRYGKDELLAGHKLGNLIAVALNDSTADFNELVAKFQKIFDIPGKLLPVTTDRISISAKTVEGKIIHGEEKIDLGKYNGKRVLEKVYLRPKNVKVNNKVIESIKSADLIIAGPGDLYTTILPVLIVPGVSEAINKSNAAKIFVVNVANKPFETKNYKVKNYIQAVKKHIGNFPFNKIIVNTNFSIKIPGKYHYKYVELENFYDDKIKLIKGDLVDDGFPLYHSSQKLAKVVYENI